MLDAIDKYLQTERAKEKGFTSRSDVAITAIREFLSREGYYPLRPRFEHLNTYDNNVKLLDNELERVASVYFKIDHETYCDVCEKSDCIHLEVAWTIPEVADVLRKHGFESPEEKVALLMKKA